MTEILVRWDVWEGGTFIGSVLPSGTLAEGATEELKEWWENTELHWHGPGDEDPAEVGPSESLITGSPKDAPLLAVIEAMSQRNWALHDVTDTE